MTSRMHLLRFLSVSLSADPRLSDFLKHGALARCERGDY